MNETKVIENKTIFNDICILFRMHILKQTILEREGIKTSREWGACAKQG